MVNSSEFIGRLEYLLQHYDLTASAFAEKIQVQRSSISHLLSGRNKPSLEFVLKVVKSFPEVNLYWLLNGKGTFPPEKNGKSASTEGTAAFKNPLKESVHKTGPESAGKSKAAIARIVIFYTDGTFESHTPANTGPDGS